MRKWVKPEETEIKLDCSIYLIIFINNKIKFQIKKNSEQLHLRGVCILTDVPGTRSLLVVEGSKKSVRKFDRLMLHRINWTENSDETKQESESDDSDDEGSGARNSRGNWCVRMWHGVQPATRFSRWTLHEVRSEDALNLLVKEKGVEQFWEMAQKFRDSSLDL